ncbi:MAG TPA: IS1595 family transposase [Caldisericia bacterium]|nr:IS1595 family transposase [Caldisericia bacterium]HRV75433.1 IS1595 family transposase [Caldisericia bacterium]
MNLLDITNLFGTHEQCVEKLEEIRYSKGVYCPYCGSYSTTTHKDPTRDTKRWQCKDCHKSFTVLTKTMFHHTRLPLPKWFMAIFLLANAKKSISSRQLSRDIGVTVKTGYRISVQIRKALLGSDRNLLKGIVEMDETYIGGKPRHRDSNNKRGRGTKKLPVIGAIERNGEVVASPSKTKKTDKNTLLAFVNKAIDRLNTTLMTDEYKGYRGFSDLIVSHKVINHALEYVKGEIHTNTIEGFWSLLKRAWYGTHHHYSEDYSPLYISEACYKYNMRKAKPANMFFDMLTRMVRA